MLQVAITSPSLDSTVNISGISSHTRLLIASNKRVAYTHIVVGRQDQQPRDYRWVLGQFKVLAGFVREVRGVDLVHLNVPLASLAISVNTALILLARAAGKPVVVHFRGGELSLNSRINFLQRAAIRIFLKTSAVIVVLGTREKEFLVSNYGSHLESKI